MFNNQHPSGSKYNSDAYKHRSRLFRPKTRATVQANEAATAQAFFSTDDVVNVSAQDDNDPVNQASAVVLRELMNYRLQKTIPWFRILVGSRQTADIYGICAATTEWCYSQREGEEKPVLDDMGYPTIGMDGQLVTEPDIEVLKDEPVIGMIEPENIIFDPACDWLDPVKSSPYLIIRRPMFVRDVKDMMEREDPKTGSPIWFELTDDEIKKGRELSGDDLDAARDKYEGMDANERDKPVTDYEIVWVHRNFMRDDDGDDVVYYTLSDQAMLSDPKPVDEVYLHCAKGERPVVIGTTVLEAFKPYPTSPVELVTPLQREANDLANLRMDGLKFSMAPIVKVRKGQKALVTALTRRAPGQVIQMDKPESDVLEMTPPTVNPQAWQEQDRINLDFDELAGSFSPGSIQSNRSMNETVGGMQMLQGGSNAITEYKLRIFTETFVEPLLRQIIKLEQAYETDTIILGLAAEKAELFQKFGMDQVTDELLQKSVTATVNVGIGATDPMMQGRKFVMAMQSFAQIIMPLIQMKGPGVLESPGVKEIAAEIFGKAGYKDGERFLDFSTEGEGQQDPQVAQMQQQMQQMMQQMQQMQGELQSRTQEKQMEAQNKAQLAQMKVQGDMMKEQAKVQGSMAIEDQKAFNSQQQEREKFRLDLARQAMVPAENNVNVM